MFQPSQLPGSWCCWAGGLWPCCLGRRVVAITLLPPGEAWLQRVWQGCCSSPGLAEQQQQLPRALSQSGGRTRSEFAFFDWILCITWTFFPPPSPFKPFVPVLRVPWVPLNQRVKAQIQMYNWSLISVFLPKTLLETTHMLTD